jgi:hypothetical protein
VTRHDRDSFTAAGTQGKLAPRAPVPAGTDPPGAANSGRRRTPAAQRENGPHG